MQKVKDLEHWPPSNFGGSSGRGDRYPTHADQVTIKDVQATTDESVLFSYVFDGREESYFFPVPDGKTAEGLAMALKKHKGESLLSISDEPILDN